MKSLLIFSIVATCTAVRAMVCFHGICDTSWAKHVPPQCKGSVIKNGGFCGCYDTCAKLEGEECQTESVIRGRLPIGTCDTGLTCERQMDMIVGVGKCVKTSEAKPARSTQTLCERRRIQSMIVQIVYPGQWFPKCDAEGRFEAEQCDNQRMCFCVDVHTGEVDQSTKIKGSANCETNTLQARSTQTLCERRRIQSMIVQIVYPGQWFPKCDADGRFEAEQCDNQGMCFCVDVHTGEVDQSTKIKGSANCETNALQARSTQTLCERRRIQSMIVQIVYPGQWFPKCDAEGRFEAEQCDNQRMCFCVDVHTGEVDQSTKIKGSANCETNTLQARSTQTLCERRRIQSMIVQIVYPGQWFPKCDADGRFEAEQCDNQRQCFCVDVHTGVVDESTKVLGSADCGNTVTSQ